ncbi:hypothetical protein GCM10023116_26060 [Kistimonas scapharcae]|uniref:Methyltransferase type 11 domain-containing protein n=1 Tax=Kistimonas scapharcae TaxID=1036133 RepID=A0ABP8V260_9GAMM
MNNYDHQTLAAQLACPYGEDGTAIAEKMNETNAFITERSIEMLAPTAGERIVEIGPGNALLSRPLIAALESNGEYIALEPSVEMAQQAWDNLSGLNAAPVTIFTDDSLSAPVMTHSVDGVMAVNVLYFIDDLDALFRKIITWLKPGGRAVFGVRSDQCLQSIPYTRYGFSIRSLAEIQASLLASGFRLVESSYYDEGIQLFDELEIRLDALIIKAIM